ncbi:MAG: hypothetical protein AAB416_03670 [Patescibacteria group bacterium]
MNIAIIAISIGILIAGGQGLYTALKGSTQRVMSCDQYIKERPKDIWVKLTDCEYSVLTALVKEKRGLDEALIPVWGANQKEEERAHIVLTSTDIELVKQFKELMNAKTDDEAKKVAEKNESAYFYQGPIEGTVSFGISSPSSKDKSKVESLSEVVDPDAVYIEKNQKPDAGYSAFLVLLGLALPIGAFLWKRRKSQKGSSVPAQEAVVGTQQSTSPLSGDLDKKFSEKDQTPPQTPGQM